MHSDPTLVSIIICAKDEGAGLATIITQAKRYAVQVIVVDGHSADNTKKITKALGVEYVLDHGLGRGDAVKLGIKRALYDVIVFFDGDGSHVAQSIPKLVEPIIAGRADLVVASRKTGGSFDLEISLTGIARLVGSDFMTWLVNKTYKTNLTDILYSFRAIRKSTALAINLKANDFAIEQEMVVACLKQGYRVIQVPSQEQARKWGVSKLKTSMGIGLLLKLISQLYF